MEDTTAPAGAPNGAAGAPLTDIEREKAVDKVTVPETDTKRVLIMGKPVELVPLKLKKEKLLVAACGEAIELLKSATEKTPIATLIDPILASLMKGYCYLAQVYGITDCNVEWIEENLDAGEVHELVQQQIDHQHQNDFLLTGLVAILTTAAQGRAQANEEASKVKVLQIMNSVRPVFSRASATPGTAPSTSS